ncbi:DUF6894 family protein [Methylobacterium sp. ID0610]|uniref:DUF6894 family protein n=1 Tax=Methylobacterium carpenticola TaxID=3344827 RepID=UPI0036AA5FBE
MPQFYFDIYDGWATEDKQGHEFPDLNAVRGEVQRLLGELIIHRQPGTHASQIRIDVRDQRGERVIMAALAVVIEENIDY